jgi:hypothetical protein
MPFRHSRPLEVAPHLLPVRLWKPEEILDVREIPELSRRVFLLTMVRQTAVAVETGVEPARPEC